jgi:hypothetical protein
MARGAEWLSFFVVGLLLAWLTSASLRYMLEAPEIRNYEPGRPVFDHPVSETYAKIVTRQLNEKLIRESIISRSEANNPVIVNLATRLVAFLLDPINLLFTLMFTFAVRLVVRLVHRARAPTKGPPPAVKSDPWPAAPTVHEPPT